MTFQEEMETLRDRHPSFARGERIRVVDEKHKMVGQLGTVTRYIEVANPWTIVGDCVVNIPTAWVHMDNEIPVSSRVGIGAPWKHLLKLGAEQCITVEP